MTKIDTPSLSRRDLLKGTGALVVAIAAPKAASAAMDTGGGKPPLAPDQLDSWIAVHPDGAVTAFFGKVDLGQSVDIAIGQIVADELDVPFEKVTVVMGDTALTINQGGASGSTGVQRGGIALRNAAAEARRLLVEMASQKFGVAADRLTVTDGIVTAKGDAAKRISYGELIGGNYFHETLKWNGKIGNSLVASGKAKPKRPDEYRVVGRSIPRIDIADKVFARRTYVTDVRVPGMVHGRMIRPPVAGAMPVTVDEASVRDIPGVRVVWEKGFLGVVAEEEWNAIRAAKELKVTWSNSPPPFPHQNELYGHIRDASVRSRKVEEERGDVESALAGAMRTVEAEYEWPFQSHSSMGPACAVVDARDDEVTIWTGSQKPHYGREGVAKILKMPPEKVRAIWIQGPGSYGRNDAGDASIDAAVLSQAVGRPVRLQGMRYEGHGWDPKGPASIHRGRAGLDAQGNVIAYWFESKGFSRVDIATNESDPRHSLAGQLMGMPLDSRDGFGAPQESYGFANKRLAWATIAPLLDRASPLRTSHLRDPVGPQIHFASESFIDELAAATKTDAVEFRLRYLKDPRDVAAVKAAAERAGWQIRSSGPRGRANGEVAVGRGIAYAKRGTTVVAVVAEVEVELKTGKVWPKRYVVAHDCGLIVNPEGLRYCIEGNLIHATSRALWEEVTFDPHKVTSIDWRTYHILDIAETPEKVEIVLINRPELPPSGAGEPSSRPVPAALANAIFDATGVRLRQAPFTPARIKAGLV
jgi:CO/xanthine dehydrogenase Mo-binding subunit